MSDKTLLDAGAKATASLSPEELSARVMARARARRAQVAEGASKASGIPVYAGEGPPPLSLTQERLWLLDRLDPGNVSYNMPFPQWLHGPLAVRALADSRTELARRQASLRTRFAQQDGRPVQIIEAARCLSLPTVDLSGLPDPGRRALAQRLLRLEAALPFDLAAGPLWRMVLLRLGPESHALSVTMHHIISDGWSLGVCFDELSQLYFAYRAGKPSPLPPLPVQYADFAVWQRERLAGRALNEQTTYWLQRLAGVPALDLPFDRPRPSVASNRGALEYLTLPKELVGKLDALSRAEQLSLFMLLLAAFKLLLSRWSGQEDVVLGAPAAGRTRTETERLIGFFLNPLVLRTNLGGNPTLRELLQRVREVVLGGYRHQEVPFEQLLAELQPERSVTSSPLFQVQFNMFEQALPVLRLEGLETEPQRVSEEFVKFDLNLYVQPVEVPGGRQLGLGLAYSVELFDQPRMAELLAQFEHLLRQIVTGSLERPIDSFSLLTAGAAEVLPDPRAPLAGEVRATVHRLFAARAAAHPDRLAVVDEQGSWSYGELSAAVNQLARWLLAGGLSRGDVVAIYADRSSGLAWATLATLEAGGAFMILDAAYPPGRQAEYVRIAKPAACLALAGAGELSPELPPELTAALDEVGAALRLTLPPRSQPLPPALAELSPLSPTAGTALDAGPDDAACLTFTSGSTGTPKAVVGRHDPLSWFLPLWCERFGLDEHECFGMLSALSHDPLQRDLFIPLCSGARLVVPDQRRIGTPGRLAPWLAEEEVTVLHLTPAMLELVNGDCARVGIELPALAHAFVVGDLLKRDDVERLRAVAPAVEVINLYGSTETQRAVSVHPVAPPSGERKRQGISLGRGLEGVQLLVLDRAGGLAGISEVGEIWIRSRHLARGYLADPRLTADRFRPHPLAALAGHDADSLADAKGRQWAGLDRAYRTGDLGRYNPAGDVDFAGRADRQVQVRGFRIETGEVEAVLQRQPTVESATVLVARDDRGEARLVAYVTPASGLGWRELRGALARDLPDYMIPSTFVRLERIPMTRTGKIDRRALARQSIEATFASHEARAPEGPLEELIADGWRELLGVHEVSAQDNFFALGGHSLLGIRLLARLRSALGVEIPLRALFEAPTIAELATAVAAELEQKRPARPPLVAAPGRADDLDLSFGQQRMWFLNQLEPGVTAYNLSGAVGLTGRLVPAALASAFTAIVGRHQTLRSSFPTRDGEACWVIAEPAPFKPPTIDLSGLAPACRERLASHLAAATSNRPFDISRGPLLRVVVIDLGPEGGAGEAEGAAAGETSERRHVMALSLHHIAADGWSLGVLVRELGAFYAAAVVGEDAALAPLALQYSDFARWQRAWLSGPVLTHELAFWTERFTDAPTEITLATDRPRPANRSYRGVRRAVTLPLATNDEITRTARALKATPYMVLLAAWATLLSRSAHQEDLVIGTPVAGRTDPALEGLIGFFANTLALRLDLGRSPRFDELVERVKGEVLSAYSHPDLPFERLVDELATERSFDRSPVFQVMFSLQNTPPVSLELPGLTLAEMPVETDRAPFDLTLVAAELPEGLMLRLETASDLFDRTTGERMLRSLRCLLEGAIAAPATPLAELPLLAAGERHQLLVESNDTARAFGPAARIEERIEERIFAAARRTPDAVALVAAGCTLSYGELSRRARELGADLARRGVGAGTRVGFAVPRDPRLLIGMLGVLAAGGSYVPLDPDHPQERLAWILEDSRLAFLLGGRAALDALPASSAARIELTREGRLAGAEGRVEQRSEQAAEKATVQALDERQVAYALYTSGSTGRPKGVEITHRSVTNFLASMAERPGLGAGDVLLAVTTLGFDISVLELLLPLTVGGRVAVVDAETAADPALLAAALETAAATAMQATPATWRLLLEGGWPGRPGLKALAGGEALPPELARQVAARCGELWNVYGPTETTVWSAVARVERVAHSSRAVAIGRPIANTSIVLVDPLGRAVAQGTAGELLIGGEGLARGYLGRPALTAERFVPDPHGSPGGRRYRTGDLARRRGDGALEYLGRIDSQVKVRGFRIELGEIESVLGRQPEVAQAVAAVREDIPGERRLVAYVVPAGDAATDFQALRAALAESLPDYMVPALWVEIEALPLSSSGKVDRRALAEQPLPTMVGGGATYVAPRSRDEQALAEVWSSVLGREQIGVHDNFFSLGGDSILAIRVVSRAADVGLTFAPRDLFRYQTVAELAAIADASGASGSDGGGPLNLLPEQRRLLTDPRPVSRAVEVVALRPPAGVDPSRLEAALAAVAERCTVLQARFFAGAEPRAEITAAAPVPWSRLELAATDDAQRRAADLAASLDPAAGPLLAAAWVSGGSGPGETGAGDTGSGELLIAAHRLAVDDASWLPLLAELAAVAEGAAPTLDPEALRHGHRRMARLGGSAVPALEREAWQAVVSKPVAALPRTSAAAAAAGGADDATIRSLLPAAETAALSAAPAAAEAELSEVLLAAVVQTVAGWAGARRLAVAVAGDVAERRRLELDETAVGSFAPRVQVVLEAERDAATTVTEVRGQMRRSRRLATVWGLVAGGEAPPAAEIAFRWWEAAAPQPGWSAVAVWPRPADAGWALAIEARLEDGALVVDWRYDPALLSASTIEALASGSLAALRALAAAGKAEAPRLIDLFPHASLSSEELEKLLSNL